MNKFEIFLQNNISKEFEVIEDFKNSAVVED